MSARDQILADIRRSLLGVERDAPSAPREYRVSTPPDSLVERFIERAADYRAVVERCRAAEVESRVALALAGRRAVVPSALPCRVSDADVDDGLSAADLDNYDAVVTAAAVGIAETGTIVLDHGPDQGRRALSLIPDLHVCVLLSDQIVAGVPDAVLLLDPLLPQTWISGPSATSDIELERVEGVHGPRRLHIVIVDAPTPHTPSPR